MWDGLTRKEQLILSEGGWDSGAYNDSMSSATSRAQGWYDPLNIALTVLAGRLLIPAVLVLRSQITLMMLTILQLMVLNILEPYIEMRVAQPIASHQGQVLMMFQEVVYLSGTAWNK